jgi:hypothetical protein
MWDEPQRNGGTVREVGEPVRRAESRGGEWRVGVGGPRQPDDDGEAWRRRVDGWPAPAQIWSALGGGLGDGGGRARRTADGGAAGR